MSINKQIVELHNKLQTLVDGGELYFSEPHRKFIVTKNKGGVSYYVELPPKLSGLIYGIDWGTETIKVDICDEPSPEQGTNTPQVIYSTEVLEIEKLDFYGEYHTPTLEGAIYFATRHHVEQIRKSNHEPYVLHLFEVLNLIKSADKSVNGATLIAAVLHDIVEDTHVTIESIEYLFGSDIASIIAELTCENAVNSYEKKQVLLEQVKTASVPAKTIKLADVISNISSIPTKWTYERKESYLNWCDEVAAVCKGTSENLYHVYIQKRAIFSDLR